MGVKLWFAAVGKETFPTHWEGNAVLAFSFLEDFIPILVFVQAGALTWDFWIGTLLKVLWELFRDSPLKQQVTWKVQVVYKKVTRGVPGAKTSPIEEPPEEALPY